MYIRYTYLPTLSISTITLIVTAVKYLLIESLGRYIHYKTIMYTVYVPSKNKNINVFPII